MVFFEETLYICEALRQLNDSIVYRNLDTDPTEKKSSHNLVLPLANDGVITEDDFIYSLIYI